MKFKLMPKKCPKCFKGLDQVAINVYVCHSCVTTYILSKGKLNEQVADTRSEHDERRQNVPFLPKSGERPAPKPPEGPEDWEKHNLSLR